MKKILIFTLALCFAVISSADEKTTSDNNQILTDKTIIDNDAPIPDDRGNFISVSALYKPKMNILEISCYEMKQVSVYILDKQGKTVEYDSFDSTSSPFFMIDAPSEPGTYTLIIGSPVYYTEGIFTVE